jgi:hypothetical protein
MTLADAGWVRAAPEPPTRWELTAHIFTLAHLPHSSNELRQRARRILEGLRDRTGETVFLVVPDIGRFTVVEVMESPHSLRMALRVGEIVPVEGSATSQTVLAYLSPERRAAMLGRQPAAADLAEFATALERGYGSASAACWKDRPPWLRRSSTPMASRWPRSGCPAPPTASPRRVAGNSGRCWSRRRRAFPGASRDKAPP